MRRASGSSSAALPRRRLPRRASRAARPRSACRLWTWLRTSCATPPPVPAIAVGVSVSACPFAMPVMTRVSAEPACCVSSKSAAVGPSPDLTVRPCVVTVPPSPSAARRARSACSRFTCASAASSRRLVFLSSRSDLSVYAMSLTHFPLIVSYICLRYPYSTAAGQ